MLHISVDVKTNWQQGFESFTREKPARKILPDTGYWRMIGQDSCILERIGAEVFKAEIKMGTGT